MSNQSDSLDSIVIGDGVMVKGTFTVPSKAIINGVIEGDLTEDELLIGPTGKITGRIKAKVIDVRGELHNDIISEKSLIVRSSGKLAGKVHYSEIEIEKGGEIEGVLNQGLDSPPVRMSVQAPVSAPTFVAPTAVVPPLTPAAAPSPAPASEPAKPEGADKA